MIHHCLETTAASMNSRPGFVFYANNANTSRTVDRVLIGLLDVKL